MIRASMGQSALSTEFADLASARRRCLGWDLVTADATAGRIEATDTFFWFSFKERCGDATIRQS